MALPNQTRRLMALAVAAAALLATFFFLVRPRLLRWGASESEVRWVAVRRRHRLRPDRLGGQGHALLVLLEAAARLTRQVGTPPWVPYAEAGRSCWSRSTAAPRGSSSAALRRESGPSPDPCSNTSSSIPSIS